MAVFLGIPEDCQQAAQIALTNLSHLGTHDVLCSLVGEVKSCLEPTDVIYMPCEEFAEQVQNRGVKALETGVTVVTLSRFKKEAPIQPLADHWYMSGGKDTELIRYVIPGRFRGTTKGKIYQKTQ